MFPSQDRITGLIVRRRERRSTHCVSTEGSGRTSRRKIGRKFTLETSAATAVRSARARVQRIPTYLPTYLHSYARLVSRARTGIYKYKSESCHAVCRAEARRLVAVAALSASHLAAQPPVRRYPSWTHFSVAQVLPRSPGILGSDIRGPRPRDAFPRAFRIPRRSQRMSRWIFI